jgi:hypothetical protein
MTAVGILNPNSKFNQSESALYLPPLPISTDAEIHNVKQVIRAVENLRAFRFAIGDKDGARLQAIRLGCLRAELRELKRGM